MDEYLLNFVIPRGEAGQASVTAVAILIFRNSSSNGNLQISGNTLLPSNTSTFRVSNNQVMLNEIGFYEFTISGLIRKTVDSQVETFIVVLEENGIQENFIEIKIQNTNEIYFSQEKVLIITNPKKVFLTLQTSSTDISVQNVNLIIKKLPD